MKTFNYPVAVFALLGLLIAGCNKNEEIVTDAALPLKGKPVGSAYPMAATSAQLQVYGVWHAGNDYCTWATVRNTGTRQRLRHQEPLDHRQEPERDLPSVG
jgi:hypothetical protein